MHYSYSPLLLTILVILLAALSCQASSETNEAKISFLTNDKSANTIAYPTCRTWSRDGKWVFIESNRARPDGTKQPVERQLLKINTQTREAVHLAVLEAENTANYGAAQITVSTQYHFDYAQDADVLVYYDMTGHNMYLLDPSTGKSKKILHEPEGTIGDPPAITPDGTRVVYYVLYPSTANRFLGKMTSVIFALDVNPKTLEAVGEPKIITAFPQVLLEKDKDSVFINHCQVNPKNKDHYCYAHQYMSHKPDGSPLLSRCWENLNGMDKPVDICAPNAWQTHETIGPKGKSLYMVERWDIVSVDFKTGKKRRIYKNSEGYFPCHITVSPDEKWIVADMFFKWEADANGVIPSGLLLVNVQSGKAKVICRFNRGVTHPAHPHPNFSPDGKKVAFVVADGRNTCQVACVDLTEMVAGW